MIESYPLQWPSGWPRTERTQRSKYGRYVSRPGHTWKTKEGLRLSECLEEVEREVRLLLGKESLTEGDLIISTNMRRRRSDGGIYAHEKEPNDSGVAVYFRIDGEYQVIANDKWATVKENLHAIALTIDRLRGLDRDGSSEILRRAFAGFSAIPEDAGKVDWRTVLQVDGAVLTPEELRAAFRRRMKEAHPDAGGSDELTVQNAYEQARRELFA